MGCVYLTGMVGSSVIQKNANVERATRVIRAGNVEGCPWFVDNISSTTVYANWGTPQPDLRWKYAGHSVRS